jgi:hypothetical protein
LNAAGNALAYSTFAGGPSFDYGSGIAVDRSGNAYVAGVTSGGFPTTPGSYDTTHNGGFDGFVLSLDSSGAIQYSTYVGGNDSDGFAGIAVDRRGRAYMTSSVRSADYPTTPDAFDTTFAGFQDAVVTELNATGTAVVYSTFLGQGGLDFGSGIAVDRHGDAYVAGFTQSAGFPTTQGAFDTTFNGDEDAFVTKLGLGTRRLDHFKCYTARSRATGKPRWVTLRDQFGTKRALVGPPARLGNPVSKNRQG